VEIADLTVDTVDGPMRVYSAAPDGGASKAVIVIQEAFGVNDHIEDVTRRFADAGYHAVAPALFHRAGGGTAPYDDFSQVFPLYEGLDDAAIMVDVRAAIEHLRRQGFAASAIGIVGFCMGGRVTFLAAVEERLGAAVGFYGGGIVTARFARPSLVERARQLQTPWLGLFGDRDESIPVEDVEVLRSSLSGLDVEAEVVRYPDAEHGFHCDARPAYDAASAEDAWTRTLAWLGTHLS
jgi:carboxymethylenebutenolidase